MYRSLRTLAPAIAVALAGFSPATTAQTPEAAAAATPAPLLLSGDAGASWQPLADGLPDDAQVRQVVDHAGTLYAAVTGEGLYVLPEGHSTWQCRNAGLPQRHDFPLLPTALLHTGTRLVLGTFADGAFVSDDEGSTWRAAAGFEEEVVSALHAVGDTLLAGTHTGVWRSLDGGSTWLEYVRTGGRVNALASHGGRVLVAAQNEFGVLAGRSVSWSPTARTGSAILQFLREGEAAFAVTASGTVYRSADGTNWLRNPVPLPLARPGALPAALWAGYRPDVTDAGTYGLIYATRRGWVMGAGGGC